jgi:hypothetical protein
MPPHASEVESTVTGTALTHAASGMREGFSRSCLIFESKRMPRRRYTTFDVLPASNHFRDAVTMDMYNRMPARRAWRIVAHVRAVLTTASPLLTA